MMDDSFKNYWMNKLKYFSLFILLFAIYWFPDVILGYPEIYLKSLVGYDRQATATWIFLGNMAISLFLGILICYKLGYYKNTLSIFKIKNILFLLFTTIVLFIIYFFTFTYYNSHFITPGIAKEQAAYSRQIVFPFVQFISFAICAPIFEEAAFRTTIYRFFKNDKIAFIVSSISFAWMNTYRLLTNVSSINIDLSSEKSIRRKYISSLFNECFITNNYCSSSNDHGTILFINIYLDKIIGEVSNYY